MAAHKHEYFLLVSRHLGFLPPAHIHTMKNSFVEFLDLENISIAVGIEQLHCIYRLRYKYFQCVIRHFVLLISA